MTHPNAKPVASISLDADNLWSYLRTHGDATWVERQSYLTVLADRMFSLFDDHGLIPTVFVVGADAATPEGREFVARLVERGIEVGNHSFEHEPWLHLYTPAQLRDELRRTQDAIQEAGAVAPKGFRGPGYSMSADLARALIELGFEYDASVLATWIGPLARAYYLRSNDALSPREREQRKALFGSSYDALLPNNGFTWTVPINGESRRAALTELPVSVFPGVRIPMHASYALYLDGFSPRLAQQYVKAALLACRATRTTPSILLHPLDLLDAKDAPGLEFFPGMSTPAARKRDFVDRFIDGLKESFDLGGTARHAAQVVSSRRHRPAEVLSRGRS